MNQKTIIQNTLLFLKKHEPELLTGSSIASYTMAIAMTAKIAPKIAKHNEELEKKVDRKLKFKEKVTCNFKQIFPIAAVYITGTTLSIMSCSVGLKRNAILATTLAATEVTLNQYKDKTVKLLSEKAANDVKEAVLSDKIEDAVKEPIKIVKDEAVQSKGIMPCWDGSTNQKFYATMEDIRKVQNDLNEEILQGFCGFKTLNDYYTSLGLDTTSLGDETWWDVNNLCKIEIQPIIKEGEYALYVEPKNLQH